MSRSWTSHRHRCGPPCSTRARTCAPSRRCTGSCAQRAGSASAAGRATHPPRTRPELVATAPGQVWSWDITKLHGPARGVYYDLYVIIDIYSRYVPGWLVAPTETGDLAKAFIADAIATA